MAKEKSHTEGINIMMRNITLAIAAAGAGILLSACGSEEVVRDDDFAKGMQLQAELAAACDSQPDAASKKQCRIEKLDGTRFIKTDEEVKVAQFQDGHYLLKFYGEDDIVLCPESVKGCASVVAGDTVNVETIFERRVIIAIDPEGSYELFATKIEVIK